MEKSPPPFSILHDGKFVCGGNTPEDAIDIYLKPDTLGTIQNLHRLGKNRNRDYNTTGKRW